MWIVCSCGQIVKTNSKTGRKCPKCNRFININKAIKSNRKLINKESKKIEITTADAF